MDPDELIPHVHLTEACSSGPNTDIEKPCPSLLFAMYVSGFDWFPETKYQRAQLKWSIGVLIQNS
jgi:hypothetical protein